MRLDLLTAGQGKLSLKTIKISMIVHMSELLQVQEKMFDQVLVGFSLIHTCISLAE